MAFRFKGEERVEKKKKKKSKSKTANRDDDEEIGANGEDVNAWIVCSDLEKLKGPFIIYNPTHNQLLNHVQGTEKVSFRPPPLSLTDPTEGSGDVAVDTLPFTQSLAKAQPWVASQVFLAHPHTGGKYTIKSCFDKLLSCDKIGVVSCEKEAAGPCETWIVSQAGQSYFSFKTFWGTYLSVKDGVMRGDAETVGETEMFGIKMQKGLSNEKGGEGKKKGSGGIVDLEREGLEKSWSFGGKMIGSQLGSVKELAKAKKVGNLHEVLLDRRAKLKKDKFC